MKKLLMIFFIILSFGVNFVTPVFSLEIPPAEATNTTSATTETKEATDEQDDMFAPIDLDLSDYTSMNKKPKRFKLLAEKTSRPDTVQSSGDVWSEDKLFLYNYYADEANLRALPCYGSLGSYVTKNLDENTSIMIGQDGITSINGDTVNFAYANSSYYSSGARLDTQGKNVNYSVGAFTETDTLNQEIAGIVTTKPKSIMKSKGKFYVGAGTFTNLMSQVDKTTTGMFAQYKNDKLSFAAQIARSQYSKDGYENLNSAHFITLYRINDRVLLKNKFVNTFDTEEIQGEVGIVITPLKETDRLKLKFTAANYQSQNTITRQRVRFTTSFKI